MSQSQPKWRVRTPRAGEAAGVEVYDGDQYVCQMSHHPAYRAQSAEYARRIVACVNACEGYPTDDLEDLARLGGILAVKAGIEAQLGWLKSVMSQRDDLLAALEAVTGGLEASTRPESLSRIHKIAEDAIARAKGGAA